MAVLQMKVCGVRRLRKVTYRESFGTLRIEAVDDFSTYFPQNDRIAELFELHVLSRMNWYVPELDFQLVVLSREEEGKCSLVVEIPPGTTSDDREPFLDALAKETVFGEIEREL